MINHRLMATVVAALLLLCGLLFVAVNYEQHRHGRVMNQQLKSKVAELDRRLTQLAVVPRLLAEHPGMVTALIGSSPQSIGVANAALRQAQVDSNAEFAFLLDTKGTTIAASNYADEVSFVGRNYAFRPYFTGALEKAETTFFAVGATTGIPGYFVANPVLDGDRVAGVVVVKFELKGLLDAWRLAPYHWLATDEFGVVILSTNSDFLYLPVSVLTAEVRAKVTRQRKYPLVVDNALAIRGDRAAFSSDNAEPVYLLQSMPASVEQWQLLMLLDRKAVWVRAVLYVLAAMALLSIVGLIYRNMRAQQRLADSEKRYAMALEREVALRTEELHSAQERLISESNFAMLGRMSAAINHEINQPLASLRLNLATIRKLIAEPGADIDEVRQIVVDTDRTTKRIGRVVTTLRNLTSRQRARHGEVQIKTLIDEVAETVKRERPTMSAFLSVNINNKISRMEGNEVLLQQALLNLLYNAFDAVIDVDHPQVQLSVFERDHTIDLVVTDNGSGVSDSVLDDLFKPFVTDESKKSGLGLGLTLVELIARDHGGNLVYEPAQRHAGSTFTLSLPVVGNASA